MNVVCVGDCGVDRYLPTKEDRAGGITLNFAVHARRLFSADDRIAVVSALGTDAESRLVREAIATRNIEAHLVEREGVTSMQYIDLSPSGEKIFVRYEQGVLGAYRVGAAERVLIAEADLLVAPHYRQIDGFFRSVMASPSRGLRAVDFADVAEAGTTADVHRFVSNLDVAFFGLTPSDGPLIEDLERIAAGHQKLFVVTLGSGGSLALTTKGRIRCAAAPVTKVVDTTGAGDTFAAGFLSEYCRSRNVAESLERGASEAARTIQVLGAF